MLHNKIRGDANSATVLPLPKMPAPQPGALHHECIYGVAKVMSAREI